MVKAMSRKKNNDQLTLAALGDKIRDLEDGHFFTVKTTRERRDALVAATVLKRRVTSRKMPDGVFQIHAY